MSAALMALRHLVEPVADERGNLDPGDTGIDATNLDVLSDRAVHCRLRRSAGPADPGVTTRIYRHVRADGGDHVSSTLAAALDAPEGNRDTP